MADTPRNITDVVYPNIKYILHLDETFAECETPQEFKGFLFPHQKTAVQALLDLENKRTVTIEKTGTRFSNSIVLAEPLGSGKTIMILAMILHRPRPKAFPYVVKHELKGMGEGVFTVRHSGQALLKPNVIVVGSSVVIQWEQAIKTFTNLTYLVIGDYYGMKTFKAAVDSGTINNYDILVVKNGTLVWENKIQPIVNKINDMIYGKVFARVIYDDFDTVVSPAGSQRVNALSTVAVTATDKVGKDFKLPSYSSFSEYVKKSYLGSLAALSNDKILFKLFAVKNDPNYVKRSTNLPKVIITQYKYKNPDDTLLGLMGVMGDEQANAVMEMINGDAVNTAADAIGIASASVADIFQRILGNRHREYTDAVKSVDYAAKLRKHVESLDGEPEMKAMTAGQYERFVSRVKKRQSYEYEYQWQIVLDHLDEVMDASVSVRDEAGKSLDRVMSNLKEGDCQICCIELADTDVFIAKCCGIIMCDVCCFKGCQIAKKYDHERKETHLHGSCANCKRTILPHCDLIFVDKKFDVSTLTRGDAITEEEVVEEPATKEMESVTEEKPNRNPKLQALLDIVEGKIPEAAERVNTTIKHLIEGTVDIVGNEPIKVLLFANFAESLGNASAVLTEKSIKHLRLQGTYEQKANIIANFRDSDTQVLLINASDSCAGLNLTFATDLVYMHRILDKNVEAQVAGRIQRIGRKQNARIHYLLYTNE